MKKKFAIIGFIAVSISISIFYAFILKTDTSFVTVDDLEAEKSYQLLYDSLATKKEPYVNYIEKKSINHSLKDVEGLLVSKKTKGQHEYEGEVSKISYEESALYEAEITEEGYYQIEVDHIIKDDILTNLTIAIKINGNYPFDEAKTIDVPLHWRDESKVFGVDSYGDESLPNQVRINEWTQLQMYNNTYHTVDPLYFKLEKGKNIIEISNASSGEIYLGKLTVRSPQKALAYKEYVQLYKGNLPKELLFINGTSYIEKNSSYIRMSSYQSPSVTPFDAVNKKINVIDGAGWKAAGQELVYEMNVEQEGFYKLALHYMNNKQDFSVFRTIKIDGKVPFEEMKAYEFEYTRDQWSNKVLSSNEGLPYQFYFTKGIHTISIKAEGEDVAQSLVDLQLLIDHINQFTLEIRKITGKDIDKKRSWKLTRYIPETPKYLKAYETMIHKIINDLQTYAPNEDRSSTLSYLKKALVKLKMMQKDPDELPLYFEDLYSGSGSVTQMIGDSIDRLKDQPMYLDGIYLYNEENLGKANANILEKLKASSETFLATFTSKKYVIKRDDEAINIWVSRPITYIDIMQKMVDAEFTSKTGVKVKISVMPDANKIILANAAGHSPDIAIGLPSHMPYDLAIRGAAYDLSTFDDFWKIAGNSIPGAFISYILNDGVYALPETLDFQSLVYRKDVFNSLGLEVPDTWQDVIELLPSLQRYGMNFFHTIAGGDALKWFYQTSPFIYHYGGSLYQETGMGTAINSPEAVKGINFLTDLFTTYSLPEQVPSFYNSFRYNTLPIGIADFNTYLQLENAAPELKGQWALALYPGTGQADGSISRWYIANGTGAVIMKDTDKPTQSWEFLKWWLSTEVQTEYAYRLQSTYGSEFVWLSGNIDAVKNAPIDEKAKRIILEQIQWLRDVPRTPGQYMLERGLSDVWSKAVLSGRVPRVVIDQQTIVINREIRKKMIEFGYLDEEGNELKPYVIRDIDWVMEQIEKE